MVLTEAPRGGGISHGRAARSCWSVELLNRAIRYDAIDRDQSRPALSEATSIRWSGEAQTGEAAWPAILWADSREATNPP